MKYVSIRKPEAGPFGDTFFDASVLAMVEAFSVNSPLGGWVESVLTLAIHSFVFGRVLIRPLAVLAMVSFLLRTAILRLVFEVSLKPIARLYRDLLQCPRLFEKMGRTRHDRKLLDAPQCAQSRAVELDHLAVFASNNEERWRFHPWQCRTSQVRPASS
jgi:hypothetical protein